MSEAMEADEIRDELKRLGDLIRQLIENSQAPPASSELPGSPLGVAL